MTFAELYMDECKRKDLTQEHTEDNEKYVNRRISNICQHFLDAETRRHRGFMDYLRDSVPLRQSLNAFALPINTNPLP